jgi:predicted KAP-like P-loop ATPase
MGFGNDVGATSVSDQPKYPKFDPDLPIAKASDDRLGRADFARSLARAIETWRGDSSHVMALYGEWGSGKSSIKNMAVEYLQESGKLDLLEFNPWMISGEDRLVEEFFSSIGSYFKARSGNGKYEEVAKRWFKLGSVLAFGATATKALKPFATFIPGGSLVAETVEVALESGVEASKSGAQMAEQFAAAAADLGALKLDLRNALEELDKPLLVILDDIDRLTHDEIRVLFRVVKSNVDLPNLRFLLLFDRDVVESALDGVSSKGRDYLDKIVQLGFDVPPAKGGTLEVLLTEGIERVLAIWGGTEDFEDHHAQKVMHPGVVRCAHSPRNVARLLNHFMFSMGHHAANGALEVNAVDLLAIEAIRVCEPDLFNSLPDHKDLLTDLGRGSRDQSASKKAEAQVSTILALVSETRREPVKELLTTLFPGAAWAFHGYLHGNTYSTSFLDQWFRQKRICHPTRFDTYFTLHIADHQLTETEYTRLKVAAARPNELLKLLHTYNGQGKFWGLLDRLDHFADEVERKHIAGIVQALVSFMEKLPSRELTFLGRNPDWDVCNAIRVAVRRIDNLQDGSQLLLSVCRDEAEVFGVVACAREFGPPIEGDTHETEVLLTESDASSLRQRAIELLVGAASDGTLLRHNYAGYLFYRWLEFAGLEPVRGWIKQFVRDAGTAAQVLGVLHHVASSYRSDYGVRHRPEFHVERSLQLLDQSTWESLITDEVIGGLPDEDQALLREFRDQLGKYVLQQSEQSRDAPEADDASDEAFRTRAEPADGKDSAEIDAPATEPEAAEGDEPDGVKQG